MALQHKKLAFFNTTYDSFTDRRNCKLTVNLERAVRRKLREYKDLEIVDVLPKVKKKTNDGIREAIYNLHQYGGPVSAIMGLRVIEGRHTSAMYANRWSSGYILYAPLQKTIFPLPLDNRSVTVRGDFVGSVSAQIYHKVLENWAEKKGINLTPGSALIDDSVQILTDLLGKLEEAFNSDCTSSKMPPAARTYSINNLVNRLVRDNYITRQAGEKLKGSCESMREFLHCGGINGILESTRLIAIAIVSAPGAYLSGSGAVGKSISQVTMEQLYGEKGKGGLVNNQLYDIKLRNMLVSQKETIRAVLQSDNSAAHVPLFYVPAKITRMESGILVSRTPLSPDNQEMQYLPCVDIQLTSDAAREIMDSRDSEKMLAAFANAVAHWAKKL